MLPPAAKPTSTRTGLLGQFCAKAGGAASDAANAAPDVSSERREMNGMVRITLVPQQSRHTGRQALPQPQHGRRCGARSRTQKVAAPAFVYAGIIRVPGA